MKNNKFYRIFLFIILICFCFISPNQNIVYALDESTEEFYAQNNILFYEPCSNSSSNIDICGSQLPEATIQKIEAAGIKEKAEANMERYKYAEDKTGIPWTAIAALHYREGGMDSGKSIADGEPLGDYTSVDGQQIHSDPNADAEEAANHLKSLAQSVYSIDNLSSQSSSDDWGNAFLAYNRGSMYKSAGEPYNKSPYVMNYFDDNHMDMVWIHADSWNGSQQLNNIEGKVNTQLGAMTIFAYLCGSSNSSTSPKSSASSSGKYDCNEGGGNAISQQATNLAWPEGTENNTPKTPKPEFIEAANSVGTDTNTPDCGVFVATVILSKNIDSEFPKISTSTQQKHMESSSLWDEVENKPENYMPGDIFVNSEHTFIFLGNDKKAEASLNENYGVIHPLSWDSRDISSYKIFRLKSDNSTLSQTNSGTQCGCVDTSGGLKDGGFSSKEEAEAALIQKYKNDPLVPPLNLKMPDTGDYHDNCVAFTNWFLKDFTDITNGATVISTNGNGSGIVQGLYNDYHTTFPDLSISNTPSAYSIGSWSVPKPNTPDGMHTGVVVGINQSTGKILIAEAGYNLPNWLGVHEYNINDFVGEGSYYVNVNSHIKGGLK